MDSRTRSGTHQILATADITRLMAFACATISDDELPIPDDLRDAAHSVAGVGAAKSTPVHPAPGSGWLTDTGLQRQVQSWLGQSGELAITRHATQGTVIAFSPPDCVADPFVSTPGPRVSARFAYHSASCEHLVLQFETMADYWIGDEGDEVLLVVPASETGGLLCSRLLVEHCCLGHNQRLRYTFRCLTTHAEAVAA